MLKIMSIIGTRPEAIKMAPVIKRLQMFPDLIDSTVCVTGQHKQMLDSILDIFSLVPDYDLALMTNNQTLAQLTGNVITKVDEILEHLKPDLVLVQGDTTTVMAAAMAAFYRNIKIGHVEAGLRSRHIREPFPEEFNRRTTALLADLHFAPTPKACMNLLREGVQSDDVIITGNTVIDALYHVTSCEHKWTEKKLAEIEGKPVLVTAHRRESFGEGLKNICQAVKMLAMANPDIPFVYPVHLNPNVQQVVYEKLQGISNVILTKPLNYLDFSNLMKKSRIILTDSGGVQEEAPALNVPVLVLRRVTERAEAVENGAAMLVGTDVSKIIQKTQMLIDDEYEYRKMAQAECPFGDGTAAEKIVDFIFRKLVSNPGPALEHSHIKSWAELDVAVPLN